MPSLIRLIFALFLAIAPFAAQAHEYRLGDLQIDHPWTRATPPGAPVAGGYLAITNTGATPDRLVSASFSASGRVEIHEMKMEGDVMKMAELPGGLAIPPGATVKLEPGGLHLMFMELKEPLAEGAKIKAQLVFEKAGTIDVEFAVEKLGAKAQDHKAHGEHKAQ
jgi:periplasmic copper chaperone A